MTMDPQDYMEIQQLYAAYGHRMDSGDAEGWANLYTPDGAWEKLDGPGGKADFGVYGREDLAAFAREDFAARGRCTRTSRTISSRPTRGGASPVAGRSRSAR
jgi:hypothetical protein